MVASSVPPGVIYDFAMQLKFIFDYDNCLGIFTVTLHDIGSFIVYLVSREVAVCGPTINLCDVATQLNFKFGYNLLFGMRPVLCIPTTEYAYVSPVLGSYLPRTRHFTSSTAKIA